MKLVFDLANRAQSAVGLFSITGCVASRFGAETERGENTKVLKLSGS
jgi:hypothetical protein